MQPIPPPSWAECWAAAESVQLAPLGSEAVDIVRPRGPIGIFRRRGPLTLQFYVAARDQLLVWRGPNSLALLQPPGERPSPLIAPGLRLAALRMLARRWDTALFAGPAVVLLGLAGVAALVAAGGGGQTAALFGVLFALGAMSHVLFLMISLVVTALTRMIAGLVRGVPSPDRVAADVMPGRNWTVVLCHHAERRGAARLLSAVDRQLARILIDKVLDGAVEDGVRIVRAVPTEDVVVSRTSATSEHMRNAVDIWTEQTQDDALVSLRLSDHRPAVPPSRIFESGGFLAWYIGGVVVVLAVVADLVAGWEQEVCGTDCAGRPAAYGSAMRWLLQRLLLSDPYGLSPATRSGWIIGWLVSVMAVTGLFVAVAALQQYLRARRDRLVRWKRRNALMPSHTLIMVATDIEYQAVSAAVRAVTKAEPRDEFLPHQVVTRLGTIERTRISLVQVEPGTVGPGSAAIAAAALVNQLEPDFLILTGICYGLRPDEHEFGDVLVCTQLRAIDLRKVAEPPGSQSDSKARTAAEAAHKIATTEPPPGEPIEIVRGDFVTPSPMLLGRLRAAARQPQDGARVHFGPMLTANTLVSSRKVRDELRATHPDAIGGEMEGAGIYAAAAHAKVDWIVAKGICDWGFDKTDEFHRTAARNAAALIVRTAEMGALDDPPTHGAI